MDGPESLATGTETDAGHYRHRIGELTLERGAMAFELAEQWLALGYVQQRAEDHEQAVVSFETALHIERIHKGLHHPDQIPVIESLAQSNRRLEDWEAVEQNHKLLRWVNERARPGGGPERIGTMYHLALWHLEASDLPTRRAPFSHLSEASDLAEEAIVLAGEGHGSPSPDVIDLLILKAAVSHRITHHVSTWIGEPVLGVSQESIGRFAPEDASDALFRQNLFVSHYAAGRDALVEAGEVAGRNGDKARHARCEQLLGDWHLLFGRRDSAAKHYERALPLAREAGIDLFAKPRSLPDFIQTRQESAARPPVREHYVRTRFDIDPQGRAQNVEILEVNPPGRNRMPRQARQQLREMRFRPRFQGGQAVKSEGIEIRIVFPQPHDAEGVTS